MDNLPVPTFNEILLKFRSFLDLKDDNYIKLTYATILGNQIPNLRPIWLMLVAPPSSGKTTALNALNGLKLVNPNTGEFINPTMNISDLTENSFASGLARGEKQTSLLHKIPRGGVMVFKDFTSVLSKRMEARLVIMGQLREIYDGAYTKRTGNNQDVVWKGKVGAIAGVTESVYQATSSMSAMGDRFIMYQIPQPDRKAALRYKMDQYDKGITENSVMPELMAMTQAYLQNAFDKMGEIKVTLPPEHRDEIIEVADFCSMVRSGVITDDYRGRITFVPEPEMPFRMFEMMLSLGSTFVFMRKLDDPHADNTLKTEDFNLLYKTGFDSIPIVRRIALRYLTVYDGGVDTASLARRTNYESDVVGQWMAQLNSLGVVERKQKVSGANFWKLHDRYRKVLERLNHAHAIGEALDEYGAPSRLATIDEVDQHWETEKQLERALISDDVDVDEAREIIDNEDF